MKRRKQWYLLDQENKTLSRFLHKKSNEESKKGFIREIYVWMSTFLMIILNYYDIFWRDNAADWSIVDLIPNDGVASITITTVISADVLVKVIQIVCGLIQCSFSVNKDTFIFFHATPLPISVMYSMEWHSPIQK